MKKICLALVLISASYTAQMHTAITNIDNQRGKAFDVTKSIKSYDNIDGNPYAAEHFLKVNVEGYSKNVPDLRYNIYEDEMEFNSNGQLNYVDKAAGEMRIIFDLLNTTYLLTTYTLDGETKTGYLIEVVRPLHYGLYKKERVQIIENHNSTTNTYLKDKNPYFERDKDLYILKKGEQYYKLPKNIKELKALLPDDAQRLEDYNKKSKINFNKVDDLKKLIAFLNQ